VVLRAVEVDADVILLAKSIDGVYDSDPAKNPDAKKYSEVSIDEVIAKNLQVVDMTASILARDNKMPMWVFGLNEENSIINTVKGNFHGTKVTV
jgi:uridylate kinase